MPDSQSTSRSTPANLTFDHTNATPPSSWRALILMTLCALTLGVVIALGISIAQVVRMIDTRSIYLGLDGLRRPLLFAFIILCGAATWIAYARPRMRTVACGAVGLIAIALMGRTLFRIESFYGNMIPRLTWRWAPNAEEAFADYQATMPVAAIDAPELMPLRPAATDYAGFLGNLRTGVACGVSLSADWEATPPVERWRHPVGIGWGGFSIVGHIAVTQEQRGDSEATVCYDLDTGVEHWAHLDPGRFEDEHGDGPRATPTIYNGRVYALGADGLLSCLDGRDGTLIWQHALLEKPEKQNLLWGMSGSPFVTDELVVVTPGGAKGRAIVAFKTADGTPAWAYGDDPAAYASPTVVNIGEAVHFMSFNGAGLRGFTEEGQPSWLFPWITQGERQRVNVAQPIAVSHANLDPSKAHVLISSGYGMGMSLIEIAGNNGSFTASEVWHSPSLKSKMSNFVVKDGYLYGLDNGILTCLSVVDGQPQWKQGRYGHGQILLVDEHLLIQAESGDVALVAATPSEYRQLGSFAALQDKTWNHAALAGNILVVRNDREAACFELPTRPSWVGR